MNSGDEARSESRRVEVRFDEFGWSVLDDCAAAAGTSPTWLLSEACTRFATTLPKRQAPPPPRFKPQRGVEKELEVRLASDVWARLELEAASSGIPLERLIEHAAIVHLASRPTMSGRRPASGSRSRDVGGRLRRALRASGRR